MSEAVFHGTPLCSLEDGCNLATRIVKPVRSSGRFVIRGRQPSRDLKAILFSSAIKRPRRKLLLCDLEHQRTRELGRARLIRPELTKPLDTRWFFVRPPLYTAPLCLAGGVPFIVIQTAASLRNRFAVSDLRKRNSLLNLRYLTI